MEEEVWKDIIGLEGQYQVSDMGRVRSLDRTIIRRGFKTTIKGVVIKFSETKGGYLDVSFFSRKKAPRLVHRLVAINFIPNPENKPQVNHKKGNKKDNRATELEWSTVSENSKHAFRTGLKTQKKGAENICCIPVVQMDLNGNEIKTWVSMKEAEVVGGFNNGNISNCCSGERKVHGGFMWKFADKKETQIEKTINQLKIFNQKYRDYTQQIMSQ